MRGSTLDVRIWRLDVVFWCLKLISALERLNDGHTGEEWLNILLFICDPCTLWNPRAFWPLWRITSNQHRPGFTMIWREINPRAQQTSSLPDVVTMLGPRLRRGPSNETTPGYYPGSGHVTFHQTQPAVWIYSGHTLHVPSGNFCSFFKFSIWSGEATWTIKV